MRTYCKILERILSGRADANIRFDDLRNLLASLEFEERIQGSHHVFVSEGMAKSYQVRQVRVVIIKYRLEQEEDK